MYFLILLGAVVSILKLMQFEPVLDWSWYSISMVFVFFLLWSVLTSIRKNRKKNRAECQRKRYQLRSSGATRSRSLGGYS
ncbi:TIGR04438 family Trp-rich protein [Comamonas testosteroni]|uniref:TIGR04438 family Trp-rich protein n=1 Tax=Comamonas testosteroni TaxID=285 RepID=UPI00350E469C